MALSDDPIAGIEIHAFECGHGDTILLRLNTRWALIDCHLPSRSRRQQFFDYLVQLGITKLDLVCLTHPHFDHYTGMKEVIDHFTSGGRSIGYFCDCGVEPKLIHDLLRIREGAIRSSTYLDFYRRLHVLLKAKQFSYVRADQNSCSVLKDGADYRVFPIGPDPNALREIAVDKLEGITSSLETLNELSLVLFVQARVGVKTVNVLLAADTDAARLDAAFKHLAKRLDGEAAAGLSWAQEPLRIDIVKVAHHGSLASHLNSPVCRLRRSGESSVAVISVGDKFAVLPDRKVLADYVEQGWTVLATTKRLQPRAYAPAAIISSARQPTVSRGSYESQNVTIHWDADGLRWRPPNAEILATELNQYATSRM